MEFKLQDSEKKRHFQPIFDSRDENKTSKTLLHIYKTHPIGHLQDTPNEILEFHFSNP